MTPLRIGHTDLAEYIWNDTRVHDTTVITIDRTAVALYPKVHLSWGGPGDTSGIQWIFFVRNDGTRTEHDVDSFVIGEDEKWKIALSYRGPFITALSWHDPNNFEDKVPSPALVRLVKQLAEQLRLTYLDAHELRALEIPWDELQGNASSRLDYSEMPNAFNLLFYEY
jgi:hypothetical protein